MQTGELTNTQLLCPACHPRSPPPAPSSSSPSFPPGSPFRRLGHLSSSGGSRGLTLPEHTFLGGTENRRAGGGKGPPGLSRSLGKPRPTLRAHTPPYKEVPLETLVLATLGVMGLALHPGAGGLSTLDCCSPWQSSIGHLKEALRCPGFSSQELRGSQGRHLLFPPNLPCSPLLSSATLGTRGVWGLANSGRVPMPRRDDQELLLSSLPGSSHLPAPDLILCPSQPLFLLLISLALMSCPQPFPSYPSPHAPPHPASCVAPPPLPLRALIPPAAVPPYLLPAAFAAAKLSPPPSLDLLPLLPWLPLLSDQHPHSQPVCLSGLHDGSWLTPNLPSSAPCPLSSLSSEVASCPPTPTLVSSYPAPPPQAPQTWSVSD